MREQTSGLGKATPAALQSAIMAEPYRCGVCEQEEARCECEKYCCLCQGAHDVRLCQDGLYYCLECREACDLQAQF